MAAIVQNAIDVLLSEDAAELGVFTLAGRAFALPLAAIERATPLVAVTPLPQAPEVITGVIGVSGRVVPVVSLRRRFGLPERPPALQDRLLLARSSRRELALWVDDVVGMVCVPRRNIVDADGLVPGLEHVKGVAVLGDGLVLIQDLDQCLSLDEEEQLSRAMRANQE